MDVQELNVGWLNLVRVHALVRADLERAIESSTGLGLSEGEVLVRLAFAPEGRMRMSDLAERVCLTQSSMTRVTDRLVERGLVTRETRPSNRRTVDAILAPAGRDQLGALRAAYESVLARWFANTLTEAEGSKLRTLLRKALEGNGAREIVPWDVSALDLTASGGPQREEDNLSGTSPREGAATA